MPAERREPAADAECIAAKYRCSTPTGSTSRAPRQRWSTRSRARGRDRASPTDGSYDGSRAQSASSAPNSSGRRRSSAGGHPRPAHPQIAQAVHVRLERRPWAERPERLREVRVQPGDRHLAHHVGGPAVERPAQVQREHATRVSLLEGRLVARGWRSGSSTPSRSTAWLAVELRHPAGGAPEKQQSSTTWISRHLRPRDAGPITSANPTPQACSTPSVVTRVTSAPLSTPCPAKYEQRHVGARGEQRLRAPRADPAGRPGRRTGQRQALEVGTAVGVAGEQRAHGARRR